MIKRLIPVIKVLSIVLIAAAILLELWMVTTGTDRRQTSSTWFWLITLERFALVAHAIEGTVAAGIAPSRQRSPLLAWIYVFGVGTVGLQEIWQAPRIPPTTD